MENKKLFIRTNATIKKAMSLMNISPHKCLLVINNEKQLIGTITDGDIRKSILKDSNLDKSIVDIYNSNPIKVYEGKINHNEIKKILKVNKFDVIPIVDKKEKVKDVLSWDQYFKIDIGNKKLFNTDVIIMAGGRGKRLAPFTDKFPKALMLVGGKPMITRILEKYYISGFKKFYVSTHYQKKILKTRIINDFLSLNSCELSFIDEKNPLGTIGAVRNINLKNLSDNIIVTNCDTIVSENLEKFLYKHIKSNSDITVLVTDKRFDIPYGEVKVNKKKELLDIFEKPKLSILINVGFYILKKKTIKLIPKNKYFDATDFILKAKKNNMKISTINISSNNWIEIGKTSELENFNKLIEYET